MQWIVPGGEEEGVTTQAKAMKEDLCMVRARLARCSAASQSHRVLLQCLGQKQQELQKTMDRVTSENCLVARCFEENSQELQQLEEQMAQMKKRFQIAKSEAAEAAATGRGADKDAEQSSALTASSEELLQPMKGNHQELHDAVQRIRTKEEKFCALIASWLKEDKEENEALRQEIRTLEETLDEEEGWQYQRKKEAEVPETVLPEVVEAQLERDERARRRGFTYWLQTLLLLFVGLELAIIFAVAAAMLYASWYDPEVFHRLLPDEAYAKLTCMLEAYANLACVLGKTLRAASEGLAAFLTTPPSKDLFSIVEKLQGFLDRFS